MGDRHHRHPRIALDHRASTPGVDGCSCLRHRQGRHRRGRTVRPEPHWHLGHPQHRGHPRRGSRLRAVHAGGSRRRAAVPTARGGHLQASFGPSLRLVADAIGLPLDSVHSECQWALAAEDTAIRAGHLAAGTVAAQRITVSGIRSGDSSCDSRPAPDRGHNDRLRILFFYAESTNCPKRICR